MFIFPSQIKLGKICVLSLRLDSMLRYIDSIIYFLIHFPHQGSSWNAPNWSGFVVEMRLVNARGRLQRYSIETHPELMKALMCNLGMMGVMYDITFQVNGTLIAKVQNQFVSLEDLFYNQTNLKDVVTSHYLTEISWYPFNSVTPEEEEVFRHNNTVLDSWTVKRDTLWLRYVISNQSTNLVWFRCLHRGGSESAEVVTSGYILSIY